MMTMNTMKTMFNGTLATVMTSWKNQHTPTDDPELLEQFDGGTRVV